LVDWFFLSVIDPDENANKGMSANESPLFTFLSGLPL